jgi:hypothetical protein
MYLRVRSCFATFPPASLRARCRCYPTLVMVYELRSSLCRMSMERQSRWTPAFAGVTVRGDRPACPIRSARLTARLHESSTKTAASPVATAIRPDLVLTGAGRFD